jgi:hypothetical protein
VYAVVSGFKPYLVKNGVIWKSRVFEGSERVVSASGCHPFGLSCPKLASDRSHGGADLGHEVVSNQTRRVLPWVYRVVGDNAMSLVVVRFWLWRDGNA